MAAKMTSARVVETSVNVTLNSPSQDCTHPDDRTSLHFLTHVVLNMSQCPMLVRTVLTLLEFPASL